MKPILEAAQCVAVAFKNTRLKQFLKLELGVRNGRVAIPIGVVTRWGSHMKTLQRLSDRRPNIMCVLNNPLAIPYIPDGLNGVDWPGFWNSISECLIILKKLTEALVSFQADDTISNVFKVWSDLEEFYSTVTASGETKTLISEVILPALDKRWDLIKSNIHAAAFLLDPRWRDVSIAATDYLDGENFLKELIGEKLWEDTLKDKFNQFRRSNGPFAANETPIVFWNRLCTIKGADRLAKAVLPVVTFPQGSCSVERSFSPIRDIHTSKRNRLGRATLSQLVFVKFNREWEKRNTEGRQ